MRLSKLNQSAAPPPPNAAITPADNQPFDLRHKVVPWTAVALLVAGLVVALVRWNLLIKGPDVAHLTELKDAPWILPDRPFILNAIGDLRSLAVFRCRFRLNDPVEGSRLLIRAFRRFSIWVDQDHRQSAPWYLGDRILKDWKTPTEVSLPTPLMPGDHVLTVLVENLGGPACVSAQSQSLGVRTHRTWQVRRSERDWGPVRLAQTEPELSLAREYPSVPVSIASLSGWLTIIFVGAIGVSLFHDRLPPLTRVLTPSGFRYCLLAL